MLLSSTPALSDKRGVQQNDRLLHRQSSKTSSTTRFESGGLTFMKNFAGKRVGRQQPGGQSIWGDEAVVASIVLRRRIDRVGGLARSKMLRRDVRREGCGGPTDGGPPLPLLLPRFRRLRWRELWFRTWTSKVRASRRIGTEEKKHHRSLRRVPRRLIRPAIRKR